MTNVYISKEQMIRRSARPRWLLAAIGIAVVAIVVDAHEQEAARTEKDVLHRPTYSNTTIAFAVLVVVAAPLENDFFLARFEQPIANLLRINVSLGKGRVVHQIRVGDQRQPFHRHQALRKRMVRGKKCQRPISSGRK
jgi:hypothetical protein